MTNLTVAPVLGDGSFVLRIHLTIVIGVVIGLAACGANAPTPAVPVGSGTEPGVATTSSLRSGDPSAGPGAPPTTNTLTQGNSGTTVAPGAPSAP